MGQHDRSLVFLSRDPDDHHQVVLVSGKPEGIPENPFHAQFGSVINQISFRVGTLKDLRYLHKLLLDNDANSILIGNHGISWSIYCHDPGGNNLEFFVDTDWYFPQPFLVPLDLPKSDEEIVTETERLCREQDGFDLYDDWRAKIALRMNRYVPSR